MNIDAFTKGLQRANANRKQRQAKQQGTNAANNKLVLTKNTLALADANDPVLDLEHYRVELIAKAIAHINNNKQKEMNK